jgi:hypothetical protein
MVQTKAKAEAEAKAAAAAIAQAKIDGVTGLTESLDAKLTAPVDEAASFPLTWETAPVVIPGAPAGPFEQIYQELADKAQALTGARGVYIAKVEPGNGEGSPDILHYTHIAKATSDKALPTNIEGTLYSSNDFMLDMTFPKPSGEEMETGKYVTWQAFEEKALPDAEEDAPPGYLPVHCTDVMDVDAQDVAQYSVTRLGSILAVPIVYENCLKQPSLEYALGFLQEKATALDEANKAMVEFAATEVPEGEEPPEAPKTVAEVAEETVPTPLPVEEKVFSALCIDTLGLESKISAEQAKMLEAAANAIAKYRHRFDTYAVWQQAAAVRSEATEEKAAATAEYTAAAAAVAAKIDEAIAAIEAGDRREDELEVERLKLRYEAYKELLGEKKEAVLSLKDLAVVNTAAAPIWAAAALFAGMPPTTVLTQGTGTPVWERIKQNIPSILEAVTAAEPTGPRTGMAPRNKLDFYKPLSDSVLGSIEGLAESPELQPLLLFVTTAINLRDADCKVRSTKPDAAPDDDVEFVPPAEVQEP